MIDWAGVEQFRDVSETQWAVYRVFQFLVIASEGDGWAHVSVSLPDRCPKWEEMCLIKSLFFGDDIIVVQYHPPKSEYVNLHPFCLHLWSPLVSMMPLPPSWMVGPQEMVPA
jgi:hypothetical protein